MQKSLLHRFGPLLLLLILGFSISWYVSHSLVLPTAPPIPVATSTPAVLGTFTLGIRTKTSGCTINGKNPDTNCTPGAILPVTKEELCVPGYSKSVRNVPESEKKEVYREYGIATHSAGQYEVDHMISLELGGSNDIANLWPEPADPTPGFHQKDAVENELHKKVCDGEIKLEEAQRLIVSDWLSVYTKMGKSGSELNAQPNE